MVEVGTLASADTGDEAVEELPGELVANCNKAISSATPPPGKIPSSTAFGYSLSDETNVEGIQDDGSHDSTNR